MTYVTTLTSEFNNVIQNQPFTLIAFIIGGPDKVTFEIPEDVPVVFSNNGEKIMEAYASGVQSEVPIEVGLSGESAQFYIIAYSEQNPETKRSVAIHLT